MKKLRFKKTFLFNPEDLEEGKREVLSIENGGVKGKIIFYKTFDSEIKITIDVDVATKKRTGISEVREDYGEDEEQRKREEME